TSSVLAVAPTKLAFSSRSDVSCTGSPPRSASTRHSRRLYVPRSCPDADTLRPSPSTHAVADAPPLMVVTWRGVVPAPSDTNTCPWRESPVGRSRDGKDASSAGPTAPHASRRESGAHTNDVTDRPSGDTRSP